MKRLFINLSMSVVLLMSNAEATVINANETLSNPLSTTLNIDESLTNYGGGS